MKEKFQFLNSGKSYIKHIKADKIKKTVDNKKFIATTDFTRLPETDAIIICVPTPLNEHREPDMTYIENSGKIIAQYLRKGQFVSLESQLIREQLKKYYYQYLRMLLYESQKQ